MNSFYCLKTYWNRLLPKYIDQPALHAKWLNTLSYLENCGARKIARTEHPLNVSKEILKHAAEEFRHAFYLKQQITTKLNQTLPSYQLDTICGGFETLHYLDRLELNICRYIKKQMPSFSLFALRHHAYLLVTFAIELRASEIYPIYQDHLKQKQSPVSVRSILLEEKGHLDEMLLGLQNLSIKESTISAVCEIEGRLCKSWAEKLEPGFS
jgi:hypothetical protein